MCLSLTLLKQFWHLGVGAHEMQTPVVVCQQHGPTVRSHRPQILRSSEPSPSHIPHFCVSPHALQHPVVMFQQHGPTPHWQSGHVASGFVRRLHKSQAGVGMTEVLVERLARSFPPLSSSSSFGPLPLPVACPVTGLVWPAMLDVPRWLLVVLSACVSPPVSPVSPPLVLG